MTHNDDLITLWGVSYDDALDLLVEALDAVAEARRSGLGDGDGDQDGFGHLRLCEERKPTS